MSPHDCVTKKMLQWVQGMAQADFGSACFQCMGLVDAPPISTSNVRQGGVKQHRRLFEESFVVAASKPITSHMQWSRAARSLFELVGHIYCMCAVQETHMQARAEQAILLNS